MASDSRKHPRLQPQRMFRGYVRQSHNYGKRFRRCHMEARFLLSGEIKPVAEKFNNYFRRSQKQFHGNLSSSISFQAENSP